VELDIVIFHHDTGYETSNTSESVDTHSGDHGHGGIVGGSLKSGSGETESRKRKIRPSVKMPIVGETAPRQGFWSGGDLGKLKRTYEDPEKAAAEPTVAKRAAAENFMIIRLAM
jgi:hypothetical protein